MNSNKDFINPNKPRKQINITRDQHFVQQKYLSKWIAGKQLCAFDLCKKSIFPCSPNTILFKKDFYELFPLSDDECRIMHALYKNHPPIIRKRIEEILSLTTNEYYVESDNESIKKAVEEVFRNHYNEISKLVFIQGGEEITHSIEAGISKETWEKLYHCDESVLDDGQRRVDFYYYLIGQMWRVPKRKELLSTFLNKIDKESQAKLSADRLFPYFVTIQPMIESIILAEKNQHHICYLNIANDNEIEFITSDNPVINICNELDNAGAPTSYELFWPLCPKLAMLVVTDPAVRSKLVEKEDVLHYNSLIKENAERFLIATNSRVFKQTN